MTRYELLNNNLSVIVQLIRNDIIPDATSIRWIQIYEEFYHLTGTKGERYKALAEKFNIHQDSVARIVNKLNKKAK